MKEQLELLIQLQALDLQLNQQKEEQKNLPEKLKAAQEPLDRAKETLAKSKAAFDAVQKERKEAEQALQASEEKLVKLKSRLTELKTNKEYQASLLEIEAANVEKGKIEEALLIAMDRVDLLKKEVSAQEAAAREEEGRFQAQKEGMEEALKRSIETAKELEGKAASLAEKVDKKLLGEYKRLSATRKGLAVAPIKGAICAGCHFSLPPQLIAEVKMREKILTCAYCHRILYATT